MVDPGERCDLLELLVDHVAAEWDELVKQNCQHIFLRLRLPGLDPACHVGVPAQVPGIDVEDTGSADSQVTSYIIIFRLLFTEKSLICL